MFDDIVYKQHIDSRVLLLYICIYLYICIVYYTYVVLINKFINCFYLAFEKVRIMMGVFNHSLIYLIHYLTII